MAQRKPDPQTTFDQVLKLVADLAPDEQDKLVEEMKLQWLRRALDEGEKDSGAGKVLTLDQMEKRLEAMQSELNDDKGS